MIKAWVKIPLFGGLVAPKSAIRVVFLSNNMKLKGGTLFLVLIVAMIIAVVSSSMVMLSYFNRLQVYNNRLYISLSNNVASGLSILLATKDSTFALDGTYVDLYGSGTDSVYLKKQNWGVFGYVLAKASRKGIEVKQHFLVGQTMPEAVECAIYLSDQGRSLSVCGDTRITGSVYLPTAGIRREYSPEPYTGKDLFTGKEHKSSYLLPKINRGIAATVEKFGTMSSQNIPEIKTDSLVNSFENPLMILNIGRATRLPYKVIKGNVVIVCDTALHIESQQEITDAICVARGITLEEDFKGIGQFFAFDSLVVKKRVQLQYPTVLGLIKKDFRYTKPFIKIGEDVLLKGMVFSLHEVQDLAGTYIKYEKGSLLEGISYAEGYTEVNGKVHGSVLTHKFVLNTNSSIYENYLMHAVIDQTKRSPAFLAGGLWEGKSNKRIAKCLY